MAAFKVIGGLLIISLAVELVVEPLHPAQMLAAPPHIESEPANTSFLENAQFTSAIYNADS